MTGETSCTSSHAVIAAMKRTAQMPMVFAFAFVAVLRHVSIPCGLQVVLADPVVTGDQHTYERAKRGRRSI